MATDRLRLRRVTDEDAEFMLELLNEPAFIRFVADRRLRTREDAAKYIAEKIMPSYAQHGFGFYVVERKSDGAAVGMCGLIKRDNLDVPDIGYSYFERFWGNGYAHEAGAAVLDYGRRVFGLAQIVGITSPDNTASAKVLEKLGLRFEKMVRLPGYETDSKLFS